MITAGIDVGHSFTKAVVVKNNNLLSTGRVPSGFEVKQAATKALKQALSAAGLYKNAIKSVTVTGNGKKEVDFANGSITEIGAAARGVMKIFPQARTVVDVGAEGSRALKINENGTVINFAINEKCATGTGSFVETMCRALEIKLEEIGPLSLKAKQTIVMNSHCAVFAESEVISLIHTQVSKADIARAVNHAMASRVASLVRRIGLKKEIVMIGGVAKNPGIISELEKDLKIKLTLLDRPDFISALGAALTAGEKTTHKHKKIN
ncbi:MAG: CoA activase [Firmicutes bacterium]|nr:CoA activase [Bacillota bacterium]